MDENLQKAIDLSFQESKKMGLSKKKAVQRAKESVRLYEQRYGGQDAGFLSKVWSGLKSPFRKAGQNIYTGTMAMAEPERLSQLYSTPRSEHTAVEQKLLKPKVEAEKLDLARQGRGMEDLTTMFKTDPKSVLKTAGISTVSPLMGLLSSLQPEAREQTIEQGLKPAAGVGAWAVPVGAAGSVGQAFGLGALAGGPSAFSMTPETATPGEEAFATGVGTLAGGVMAAGAKAVQPYTRKLVSKATDKLISKANKSDSRTAKFIGNLFLKQDIKKDIGWASDHDEAMDAMSKEIKFGSASSMDKQLEKYISTTSGQIDDRLAKPGVASQKIKVRSLSSEITDDWMKMDIPPDIRMGTEDDRLANEAFAGFIRKASGVGTPTKTGTAASKGVRFSGKSMVDRLSPDDTMFLQNNYPDVLDDLTRAKTTTEMVNANTKITSLLQSPTIKGGERQALGTLQSQIAYALSPEGVGKRAVQGDIYVSPSQLMRLKRDMGRSMGDIWVKKANGEALNRYDLSRMSTYDTLKRLIDAYSVQGGEKISALTMKEHLAYQFGAAVARKGKEKVATSSNITNTIMRNIINAGGLATARVAQEAPAIPARVGLGATKALSGGVSAFQRVAPAGLSGPVTSNVLERLNALQRQKKAPLPGPQVR